MLASLISPKRSFSTLLSISFESPSPHYYNVCIILKTGDVVTVIGKNGLNVSLMWNFDKALWVLIHFFNHGRDTLAPSHGFSEASQQPHHGIICLPQHHWMCVSWTHGLVWIFTNPGKILCGWILPLLAEFCH